MLLTVSTSTARTCVRRGSVQKALHSARHFHLAGTDSASYLDKHLSGIHVHAERTQTDTSSSSSSSVSPSPQSRSKAPVVKAINVLLHADRRPKSLPSRNAKDPIRAHFGPALVGCHASDGGSLPHDKLGAGDLGILHVQHDRPSRVVDLPIDQRQGLALDKAFGFLLRMAPIAGMSVPEPLQWEAAAVLQQVYRLFDEKEGVWFSFELSFADGKIAINAPFLEFDDFALHRVPDVRELHAQREREPNTAMAEDGGLFYIKLPSGGKVGSFGYGAGNAMATMDGLSLAGGIPANFLDGGGGANKANSRLAIETLHRDPDVRAIFVNSFGGITQTDVVAEGIIEAVQSNNITKPIVVRLLGTGAERAKEVLQSSGLSFSIIDDFKRAARKAVELAG